MPTLDRRSGRKARVSVWFKKKFGQRLDAMESRLLAARSAGTPLTADEQAKLDESRAQFAAGEFTVDPETARDRDALHPAATR